MAITASMQLESGRIRLPASDSGPYFQRRPGSYCAKLTRIRSGWPGQVLAKRIWSRCKPVCRNHWARFLPERNRPATSFPLSDSVAFFGLDHTARNQPGSDSVLAYCVRFWPNGSGPEGSRCERIIRPASGQRFPADPDRMRMGSGLVTGCTTKSDPTHQR